MDGRLKACLTGWSIYRLELVISMPFFYLAEMSGKEEPQPFNSETLKTLYNQ